MDAFSEIGVFVRVVERRSFTRAAASLGITPSGVSRIVSRLEARLGVRLLERTTRSVGLTDEGTAYYERCIRILRELEDVEGDIARKPGRTPRGRLRVDAPTILGRFVLAPTMPRFLEAHPELSLSLTIRDHVIDPIAEGVDVVLRLAELRESELVQKRLGTARFVVVGSPAYFARHGRPRTPDDLAKHPTLGFLAAGHPLPWRFGGRGGSSAHPPTGRVHSNSVDTLRHAALAGFGLANVLEVHVRAEIAQGTLEVALERCEQEPVTIHALYTRKSATLPKVRVFLDFVARTLRESGDWGS